MRITQTSHHYYPHSGGTETVVKTIVDGLAERGNELHVFSDFSDIRNDENEHNVTYHGIDLRRIGKFRFPERGYWKKIELTNSDILHVQGQRVWSSDYLYTHLSKISAKKVFTAHGFYQIIYGGAVNKMYYNIFMPSYLSRFDHIICLTEQEKSTTLKMNKKKADNITVIPDPVDFKRIDSYKLLDNVLEKYDLDRYQYLIHAGGLHRNKNIEFILEGIAGLNISLVLCGNQPDEEYLDFIKRKASELKVNIKFLGSINEEELFSLEKYAKFYISGSFFESFGVSMVESSYIGTKVIAKDTGIAKELENIGSLKIVKSPSELKEAVENEPRMDNIEKIRAELRNKFSKDKIIDQLSELYEGLL